MKIDISEEERDLISRLLDDEWKLYDRARMHTRPASIEERGYLEDQQAIELLQAKLR